MTEVNNEHRNDLNWIRSARGVRDAAETVFEQVALGNSEHFELRLDRLEHAVELVAQTTTQNYPDLDTIPFHSRLLHFDAGGVARLRGLQAVLVTGDATEQVRCLFDLTITSVLLDAGAGPRWSYREEPNGRAYTRSEGLAIASFHWFTGGGLSSESAHPLRADSDRLRRTTVADLARAFQVNDGNLLVGVAGRAHLLARLGQRVHDDTHWFPGHPRRPGALADALMLQVQDGVLSAPAILTAVLEGLSPIWAGREQVGGMPLGDVWTHSRFGRIPFHKLSQWLTYSLADALERCGVRVTQLDDLTGLAEYRNGGLFVDTDVIHPKHSAIKDRAHTVDSDVVIEWRALTVALLDRLATQLRLRWHKTPEQLPLVKILEGGTWAAGRRLAEQLRSDASPPIQVVSDGTVF